MREHPDRHRSGTRGALGWDRQADFRRIDPETGAITRTVKLPDAGYQGEPGIPELGLPSDRRGRRGGLGDQPRPHRFPDRPGDRASERRRSTWTLPRSPPEERASGSSTPATPSRSPRSTRAPIAWGGRSASAPRTSPRWLSEGATSGHRREGDGLVWRIEPGPQPDHADDRRRGRRHVPRLRRGGSLGGQLQRRHRGAHRRENERRGGGAGGRRAGTRGRRRVGLGEHGRSDAGRRAATDVRPAPLRRCASRCADRLGPPAPGTRAAAPRDDGGRDPSSRSSGTASGPASIRSATAPATTRTPRPGTSTAAPVRPTPTPTRAPSSSSP